MQASPGGLFRAIKNIGPHLNPTQILGIAKLVCGVADGICPIVKGMIATSRREFAPRLTSTALLPSQVAKAYNFPVVDPAILAKRTVAIVELGGSFAIADVANYCKANGYAIPRITTVFVDNASQSKDDADGEVCLDIDVIAAVAPGLHIVVIFAPNTEQGFADGVKAAYDLDVDAVSISWGAPEDQWTDEGRKALDEQFKLCAAKGIGVFCASGDNGSGDGESGKHTDYPASSPYVVGCGGTKLELNADGTRGSETVWTPGLFGQGGAGGGGISAKYSQPTYQKDVLPSSPAGRRVPDVSGNADPNTGYQVDIDGQKAQVGGTSAVAPLYAALQILLNASRGAHTGFLPAKFYQHPECFFDVTEGNNGAFKAGSGFDCATGNGVIDGEKFLAALKAS